MSMEQNPTAEDIARVICGDADVMVGSEFKQKYACEKVSDCEACMAKANEIMRLFNGKRTLDR